MSQTFLFIWVKNSKNKKKQQKKANSVPEDYIAFS